MTTKRFRINFSNVIFVCCFCFQEKQLLGKDVQTLRRQNNNFDTDRHERDKTLNHLRTRVAVLEQEIKDKQQVLLQVF